jgi:hypothetical protein
LLSFVTWRFIETPLRSRYRDGPQSRTLALGVGAMVLMGCVGSIAYFADGFGHRWDPARLRIARGLTDKMPEAERCMDIPLQLAAQGNFCVVSSAPAAESKPSDTLIWGDSFAEALAPSIATAAARSGQRVLLAGQHGCRVDIHRPIGWLQWHTGCFKFNNAVLAGLASAKAVRKVVLIIRWPDATTPGSRAKAIAALADLERLVDVLTVMDKKVWIVGPLPVQMHDIPRALFIQSGGVDRDIELRTKAADFEKSFQQVQDSLMALHERTGVHVIQPAKVLCHEQFCEVTEGGYPLYFDNNHLTVHASHLIAHLFVPIFNVER